MFDVTKTIWTLAILAVLGVGGWMVRAHIRADAVNELVTQQERVKGDSIQKVHVKDSLALLQASLKAHDDSVRVQAATAKVRAATGRSDSLNVVLVSLKDSALAMVRDTQATVAGLKAEVTKLAVAITSSDSAHKVERVAWQNDTTELHKQLTTRTTERDLAIKDRNDLSDERTSLKKQIALLNTQMPSTLGKVLWGVGGAGIGYLAGKAMK